jgi:DNA repair protein RecO (recombination protein O)
MQITVKGLVLRETKVGDYDKIITLLTKEYGRISVSAKGSKNLKSRFLAGTQSFCYGSFTLFSSKGKYSLNELELIESFYGLRNDIAALALGGYICALAGELANENEDCGELLALTLNALYLTVKNDRPRALVKSVYELRALSIAGFAPDLVACNGCGCFESDEVLFSITEALMWCRECFDKLEIKPLDAKVIAPNVLYAMRYILFSEDKKIFSFKLDSSELDALSDICESYMKEKTEHRIAALDFYNSVKE